MITIEMVTTKRRKLRISQLEMAKEMGICRNTISNYETGKTEVGAITLNKMWQYLNGRKDHVLRDSLLGINQ